MNKTIRLDDDREEGDPVCSAVKFTNFTAENTLYIQKVECIYSCEISYCLHNAATYTAS